MLSIAKVGHDREAYYLSTVAGHAQPGGLVEPDGYWLGEGAASLGLEGTVAAPALAAVLAGAEPGSGEILSPTHSRVSVVAFDCTFSTPKSVSVLHALGPEEAAVEILAAHHGAVRAALGYLEREALRVRRATDGRRAVGAEGAVGACFVHRASRAPDPHLHTHVLVANLARDGAGRWSPIDARAIYSHRTTVSHIYEAHLRGEITARLGLRWRVPRRGWSDLVGIEQFVLDAFSQRSRQIREVASDLGMSTPAGRAFVAEITRPPKDLSHPHPEVVQGWSDRSLQMGLARGALQRLVADGMQRLEAPASGRTTGVSADEESRWVEWALGEGGLTRRSPSFSRQDVVRARCAAVREGASAADVERVASLVLSSGAVVERVTAFPTLRGPLGSRIPTGERERRFTTSGLLAVEREVLTRVEGGWVVGAAAPRGAGPPAPAYNLSASEWAVLDRLVSSPRNVEVLDISGSARDDLLDAAGAAWLAAGREVVLAAPTQQAASRLSDIGGRWVVSVDEMAAGRVRLPEGSVLAVAGAESLDPRTTLQLVSRAAGSCCPLVLLADLPRSMPELMAAQIGGITGVVRAPARGNAGEAGLALVAGTRTAELEVVVSETRVVLATSAAGARARILADALELSKAGAKPLLAVPDRRVAAELRSVLGREAVTAGVRVVPPRELGRELGRETGRGAGREPALLVLGGAGRIQKAVARSTAARRRHFAVAPELGESLERPGKALELTVTRRAASVLQQDPPQRQVRLEKGLGR